VAIGFHTFFPAAGGGSVESPASLVGLDGSAGLAGGGALVPHVLCLRPPPSPPVLRFRISRTYRPSGLLAGPSPANPLLASFAYPSIRSMGRMEEGCSTHRHSLFSSQ